MKKLLLKFLFLVLLIWLGEINLFAQCNVNDKYDKIISGYHSSVALKDNGTYAVWGSAMKAAGNADQLAPQDINSTNYTGLTGTIYKAALGGQSGGAQVDQAILLTSNGLWAWGPTSRVVSTTIKSTAAFGRITSPTGGIGSTSLGLPTGVAPSDVQSLFATAQTLIVLTKIVSGVGGNVYVLTQTSLAVEANGGTATSAGSSSWKQVKINASTVLANVTAVRGQAYNVSNNAFMAITSSGELYTWGNSTYLGDGSVASARTFATLMLNLPSEFSTSIPKMIGITGGGATGATTVENTYYVLSNAGNLYSLGNNSQKQCGDFTTTTRTSWVQVKKSSAVNDYLTDVNFFSAQEHNSSFPTVAAITSTGTLYTWGSNASGMAGRTDNGTASGTLTTVAFDPGIPVGFTGLAVSVEMGGHTMVYLKEGSSKFCYVGHYTNGSMGDGTSNNNGSSSATTLKHDCNSTPTINICGYVPISASTTLSTIAASSASIVADGLSVSTITIQLKDASGNNLTASGGVITVSTTAGTLGNVTDNNNGTYTVTLTSGSSPATANVSFLINGTTAVTTTQVTFTATLPLSWGNVNAYRQNKKIMISWVTMQEQNVSHFELERSIDGVNWQTAIANIPSKNELSVNRYEQTDTYTTEKVFYRIKQFNMDAHYNYSPVILVLAEKSLDKIVLYPDPIGSIFRLTNINPDKIKQISLLNMNGTLLKSWRNFQSYFDVQHITPGMYVLRIETTDGVQNIKFHKR